MKLNALSVISVSSAIREDLAPVFEEEDGKKTEKEKTKKVNENPVIARAYDQTGKTQEEIADETGLHASTISRLKSQDPDVKRKPSFDALSKIVKALGVQPFRELKP